MTEHEFTEPGAAGPDTVIANRAPDQECPECGGPALAVFTVTGHITGQERTLGGWAWCQSCAATPHPTLTKAAEDSPHTVVLHSKPAHASFGWCARCHGHDLAEEVRAWRARENEAHGSGLPDRAPHPSREGEHRG